MRRRVPLAPALAIALAGLAALAPAQAHADSSDWNLHLDAAFATPMTGMLQPEAGAMIAAGFFAWGTLDWQLLAPLALELSIGLGHMENFGGADPKPDGTLLQGALGARVRLFDDDSGFANQQGGSIHGSAWIAAHVGMMAWNGPQLSIDASIGYELSVFDPLSVGLFARGVLGVLGDDDAIDLILVAGISLSFEVQTGVIPNGRYGVADVRVEGLERLDEAALRACLGTRERGQLGFDFGASSSMACGSPPFDAGRWRVDLFSWPWTEWPLFDASVFERDVLRVERWLRARGHYEGRVLASTVEPTEALGESPAAAERDDSRCIADATRGCEVQVAFRVEEGEPVHVARLEIRPTAPTQEEIELARAEGRPAPQPRRIPRELRQQLRAAMLLRPHGVFDEALYEQSQRAMVRVLGEQGYPDAVVQGDVKINAERHEAFVQFQVTTGRHGVLGRICVIGHRELPAEPILAATFLTPGEAFSLSDLEEAQRAIFALGVLSSVEIRHRTEEDARAAAERAREEAASDDPGAGREEVANPQPIVDPQDPPPEEPEAGTATPTEDALDATPPPEHPDDPGADAATSDTTGGDEPASSTDEHGEDGDTPGDDVATVSQPDPGTAADQEAAEVEQERVGGPEQPPYCVDPDVPIAEDEDTRAVDLEIRVTPGRLERLGLGVGIQIGDTLSFGSQLANTGTAVTAQTLQQWDVHLLLIAEWRNLFGDMLRVRLEERPRLIFPAAFPGVQSEAGLTPSLGNKILLTIRWPAFLEPRTALFASLVHDYGPLPLFGFFRHELDARIGLERTFLDGRLYTSFAIRGNLFVPDEPGVGLRLSAQRETTRALILEELVTLDLRDDPRNPTAGAFFSLGLQEAGFGGVSSWDYFRITAEARGYVPLPLGLVIAARFGVGAMLIFEQYGLDPDNVYDLAALGPLSQQLQGGGSVSNRGFPPGFLGDVRRRAVEARPLPDGSQPQFQPILVSGGIRRWEGSLELRIPVTPEIGLVLFADVGNVSRADDFYFNVLNFAFGFGVRYRTIIGPLRFDWAFRPDELAVVGDDPRAHACATEQSADDCRPVPLLFGAIPGAIHLTIGEAF